MSFRRPNFGSRSTSVGRQQTRSFLPDANNNNAASKTDVLPNILPELTKIIRRLLPQELPFNMHVRDVEYIENGHERLTGTLYMTTFRLVFAPDKENDDRHLINFGNKYISDYDIPLTSIYKINVAPVDTKSGFKSFLNDNQIQSETRTFTIITRDFRYVTFTKCSVTKSNSIGNKHPSVSVTQMGTYIDALKVHSQFQNPEQLYIYLALNQNSMNKYSSRNTRSQTVTTMSNSRPTDNDDDIADFGLSNDERIKSFLTYNDWKDELYEANEQRWFVDRKKFNEEQVIGAEGPYVRLINTHDYEGSGELIWHWTHTTQSEIDQYNRRQIQIQKYMLITVPGIGELTNSDPLRRVTTDTSLVSSMHNIGDQPFQRYNLAKFPCPLKRLQASYEKLIEICVISPDDDDEKWWSKLNASKWLKYVSKTLHGAASLAKLLNFKNIELAGSDTDNNCLIASLIQIFLRPKCRTIKGFCELIVREWINRGHKFRERFGQVQCDSNGYPAQEAPVFLLFLDCVHQLIIQNPFAFEFTDNLLLELYHSICYCYHHTFVFNHVFERLDAIYNYPPNLLVLSAFDFSLYLYPNTCRLLKNDASIFNQQTNSPRNQDRPRQTARIETTVISTSDRPNRTVYYLETARTPTFKLDLTHTNAMNLVHSEQYDYDTIESPQIFSSNFYVDWRTINLVLWSKCYCRYDQKYLPTQSEQQLTYEIDRLKEDLEKVTVKTKRQITLDTYQYVGHANSWHPQALDTRV